MFMRTWEHEVRAIYLAVHGNIVYLDYYLLGSNKVRGRIRYHSSKGRIMCVFVSVCVCGFILALVTVPVLCKIIIGRKIILRESRVLRNVLIGLEFICFFRLVARTLLRRIWPICLLRFRTSWGRRGCAVLSWSHLLNFLKNLSLQTWKHSTAVAKLWFYV